MDLLKADPRSNRARVRSRTIAATAAIVGIALTSCLGTGNARRPASFPHDVHVKDKGLACGLCHVTARASDLPSMPPPELCAPCHDPVKGDPRITEKNAKDATFEQWRDRWFVEGGVFRRASTGQLASDVVFRHRDHAGEAKLECATCHTTIASESEVPAAMPDWKRTCMDCHAQSGKDVRDCTICHQRIDKDTLPPSHFHAWDARHGDIVRSGDDSSMNRCELCHDERSSCTECHQNNPPRNHDNLFRTRTHGFLASIDRSRCYTCHKTDSCEECHSTTQPMSHRPGFGEAAQRHCNNCHLPLADNGCATCHRSAPSHASATPLPPSHDIAMNCRQCHGRGQPLPHPDGGHPCAACHR